VNCEFVLSIEDSRVSTFPKMSFQTPPTTNIPRNKEFNKPKDDRQK